MKRALAMTAIFMTLSASGYARTPDSGPETALQMQSWCRPFSGVQVDAEGRFMMPSGFDPLICWGAFASIQELVDLVGPDDKPLLGVCVRSSVTRIQEIQVFLRYAGQHPEHADLPFALMALSALGEAFHCP